MSGPPSEQVLELLAAAPGRLAAAIDGVPLERLHRRPSPDEWSVHEVLAHLRACADVWGDAVGRLLAEDRPTIRAVNPQTWLARSDHLGADVTEALDAFTGQRDRLLQQLRPLTSEQWGRSATVTGAGRPLRRTVLSYAERLAVHERSHLRQVERAARDVSG